MTRKRFRTLALTMAAVLAACALPAVAADAAAQPGYLLHDDHFHLTNYVQ